MDFIFVMDLFFKKVNVLDQIRILVICLEPRLTFTLIYMDAKSYNICMFYQKHVGGNHFRGDTEIGEFGGGDART